MHNRPRAPAGSRMKSDIIFQYTFDYVRNKTPRKFLILYGEKSEIIRGIYYGELNPIVYFDLNAVMYI